MPEPLRCGECGEPIHSHYYEDRWQIRRDTVSVQPDGSTITSTPYAAIACSAKCAADLMMKEAGRA